MPLPDKNVVHEEYIFVRHQKVWSAWIITGICGAKMRFCYSRVKALYADLYHIFILIQLSCYWLHLLLIPDFKGGILSQHQPTTLFMFWCEKFYELIASGEYFRKFVWYHYNRKQGHNEEQSLYNRLVCIVCIICITQLNIYWCSNLFE